MFIDFQNKTIHQLFSQAEFGIERESLRVNADGTLAHSPHPFGAHKNIDRDFCENQIEIIGDVFDTPEGLIAQLHALQNEIYAVLKQNNELLWPFSNPPKFSGEDDIPVAQFLGKLKNKSIYREYLAKKYGKRKMLFSGIHLNFSFTEPALRALFAQSGQTDFRAFQDNLYLRLSKRLTEYSWLIVFLTAASPVTDASLKIASNRYASVRCGEDGYWNSFVPLLDYADLPSYLQSIEDYIASGALKSVSELYYPVRLKPRGANSLDNLREKGVNHLELRVLDVNPLSRVGIFKEDIRFIHLLLLWLASLPEFDFTPEQQKQAIADIKAAALFHNTEIKARAERALKEIQAFTDKTFPAFSDAVAYQQNKLQQGNSYAEIISARFGEAYIDRGIELAQAYARGENDV